MLVLFTDILKKVYQHNSVFLSVSFRNFSSEL